MTRASLGLLLSCAFLIGTPTAFAADKSSVSKPVEKANEVATIPSTRNLQDEVTAALLSTDMRGRSLTVMSPAKPIRLTLQERDGDREVTLVDAKTNQVTRRWLIDASTSATALAYISEEVLSDMGLSGAKSTTDKQPVAQQ